MASHIAGTRQGDDVLVELYGDMRKAAKALLKRERWEKSLGVTGLVNEAVVKLLGCAMVREKGDRRYVFGAAMTAMRRVLIERARRRRTYHVCQGERLPLTEGMALVKGPLERELGIQEAIEQLGIKHPRVAEVVALKYCLGMTAGEISRHVGLCERQVGNDLALAKGWLKRELADSMVGGSKPVS